MRATWGAVNVAVDARGPRVVDILGDGEHMFCGVHVTRPSVMARLPDGESDSIRQGYLPWLRAGERVAAYEHRGRLLRRALDARALPRVELGAARRRARCAIRRAGSPASIRRRASIPSATIVEPVQDRRRRGDRRRRHRRPQRGDRRRRDRAGLDRRDRGVCRRRGRAHCPEPIVTAARA